VLVREVKACTDSSKEGKFELKSLRDRNSRVGVALVALSFRPYTVYCTWKTVSQVVLKV
jgi:hypothetical protein